MKPWHYTNIEPGQSYQPAADGDIITALNKVYGELQHMDTLSAEQLRFDVLVLFHLCGDITQPLHVGYGSDKGGNDYQVQYNGKGTNLHHIWDTDIIESQGITMESLAADNEFSTPADKEFVLKRPPNFMLHLQLCRSRLPILYNMVSHKLDEAYMHNNAEYVRSQLIRGGILLATCLDHVFSQGKNIPVAKEPIVTKQLENLDDTVFAMVMVPAENAASLIGQTVPVCGKVYSAKFAGGSGVTFINMGGEYPNNPFTAVIMFKNRSSFSYNPEEYLNGKTICVTGTVKDYKGKPEIVVEKSEQIRVQ